jgi:hypothetical protein
VAGLGEQRLDKVRQQSEALGNHAGVRRQTQQVFNDQTEALAAACVASPRRRRCSSGPSICNGVNPGRSWLGSSRPHHRTTGADGTDHDLRAFNQHGVVRMLMR